MATIYTWQELAGQVFDIRDKRKKDAENKAAPPPEPDGLPTTAAEPERPKAQSPTQTIRVDIQPLEYRMTNRQIPQVHIGLSQRGLPVLPPEGDMVELMLKYFEGYLIKNSDSLFLYNGTYWQEMEDEDHLYQLFLTVLQGKARYNQLRDMISLFMRFVPKAPRNLHTPNPHVTAFLNGTLTVNRINGRWDILFREHRPDDFVTNIIPHQFDTTLEMENPAFEKVLNNLLGDDKDTRRALAQMYGACLAPVYPRLFMLIGKPGTGKSTLILGAVKLVSEANVSSVLPSDFDTFLAEGMIGKLVNYDTDIPDSTPLKDAVLKKVEDRAPITFNRKGRKVVRTCLPPVHIFGANQLPPTFERSVGAYERRWTFMEFNKFHTSDMKYNKDMLDDVVKAGMQGIINFAVRGLRDLLDSDGHYFMKQTAKTTLTDWQRDNDSVEMFLDDVRKGRLDGVKVCGTGLIRRSTMWSEYQVFLQTAYPNNPSKLHRNKFFQALRNKGLLEETSPKGFECFKGFIGTGGSQA